MIKPLYLHEETMLLSLHDRKGTPVAAMYTYAVAGAILAELSLMKRIEILDEKKKTVGVIDSSPTGDDLLDECLAKMDQAKNPKPVESWVSTIASISDLKHKVARSLCKKKILRHDTDKVLWIFTRNLYPEIEPKTERAIRDRMAKLMFGQTTQHDERTTLLVALAKHADLLRHNFDRDRLKRNKERIDKVAKGDMFAARATKKAIEGVQTAIMMAVIIPTVMSSH